MFSFNVLGVRNFDESKYLVEKIVSFELKLQRNRYQSFIFSTLGAIIYTVIIYGIFNFPYLVAVIGNFIICFIIMEIFNVFRHKIIIKMKEFCKTNNIDLY